MSRQCVETTVGTVFHIVFLLHVRLQCVEKLSSTPELLGDRKPHLLTGPGRSLCTTIYLACVEDPSLTENGCWPLQVVSQGELWASKAQHWKPACAECRMKLWKYMNILVLLKRCKYAQTSASLQIAWCLYTFQQHNDPKQTPTSGATVVQ